MARAAIMALAVALATSAPVAALSQPPPAPPPAAATPANPAVYEMETLRTGPLETALLKQMEPLHTLQAIEELLKANRIAFTWAYARVTAASLPPVLTSQIDALPPHEVFIIKQGTGWIMSAVLSKH